MACDLSSPDQLLHFTSGSMLDSSGNGNDATNNGSTNTTDKNSVANNARQFDGINDFIDSNVILGSVYSISFWAFIPTWSVSNSLMGIRNSSGSAGTRGFQIQHNSANNLFIQFYTSSNGNAGSLSGAIVTDNAWNHIVMTRNGNNVEIFVDKVSKDTDGTSGKYEPAYSLIYGRIGDQAIQYFDGKHDEIWIFPRVIDQPTIDALYDGYDNPTCGVVGGAKSNSLLIGANL